MLIEAPHFPLAKAAFAAALRSGHGRAVQQLEKYGAQGLDETIIEACITSLSYDPQCEAPRAPWLFSVVDHAHLNKEVAQAIRESAHAPSLENERDLDQRCAILKELAASGLDDARHLLYSSLARVPDSSTVIGDYHIVALDGVDGLIQVARQLGRWLRDDPDFWIDDGLCELCGESALIALEQEAAANPDIAAYLAEVRKIRASRIAPAKRFGRMAYTGSQIVAYATESPGDQCHWFRQWGSQATNEQMEVVFSALLATEKPEHAKRLFRCFAKTGVPRFERQLLQWISDPDEDLQWIAIRAMVPITHKELRIVARKLIMTGNIANGFALLANNFSDGDFAMCVKRLTRFEDADETHHLVGHILDLCQAHPGAEALDCLLYVYEYSPCSTCRKQAVKAMTQSATTPHWVLEEAIFDAEPETRELAREARHSSQWTP
ncbi:hypothetical protein QO207_26025 [Pseudomonas sp. CAN2814]|uniref:hypothetical protein n=1 Tax=Pseudomonas sp. CAN1 TaxID=3046726 RepID=UPI002647AABE|nr:hypothetical protein [Pseudomonas sp. CAN1]MDN6860062.1 hypothetical protein [Pseudomonas sp. CAN1]